MWQAIRVVWALLLGSGMIALATGLQGTLLGVRAALEDFSLSTTGTVMSAYSFGTLVGAYITTKLTQKVGHIRVFAACASVASISVLLHPIFVHPVPWFLLRFITGVCTVGIWIVAESWLNAASANHNRAKIISVYVLVLFSSMALGQLLLNIADPSGFMLFILISVLVSLALVPLSLSKTKTPETISARSITVTELYKWAPLAVVAAFFNGISQLAFFTMTAVYATLKGYPYSTISILVALPIIGVILSQYPVGALADRYDRRIIIFVFSIISAITALLCALTQNLSLPILMALFTLFGAASLPIYSLVIAHANDHLETDQMIAAVGKIVMIFGIGAMCGPFITGKIMEIIGPSGFFLVLGFPHILVALFALYRLIRRAPVEPDEAGEFVLVAPRITAVTATAIAEEYGETAEQNTERNNEQK